jgi:hypothetical protein
LAERQDCMGSVALLFLALQVVGKARDASDIMVRQTCMHCNL